MRGGGRQLGPKGRRIDLLRKGSRDDERGLMTSSWRVTLNKPLSLSNTTAPTFTGSASDKTPVTVNIYPGANPGEPAVATATAPGTGGGWKSSAASPPLASGQYTAVATQQSSLGNPAGSSESQTFTVDTAPPIVTLNPVPGGARITVTCRGHGCPLKSASRVSASGKVGAGPVEFRRFERTLPPGVSLAGAGLEGR